MAKLIVSGPQEKWLECDIQPTKVSVGSVIKINDNKTDQRIFGFGGAFTDAATITFNSLSKDKQEEYLKAYFSECGLAYTLGRYPIQSTDFSTYTYSYLKDADIKSFDMSEDQNRIEFVKRALTYNPNLWLCAAPWSPCAFMKDNNDMCHGGKLLPKYYQLWADTLINTVKELDKKGIRIRCLSTQNEPEATQTWESCRYTAEEEANFLKNYLIPASNREKLPFLQFFIWDHNRDLMYERTNQIMNYGVPKESLFGVAYHWYDRTAFEEVKKTHLAYPDLHILLTECCVELLCNDNNGLGSYENGLRYGVNIIKDLNNGSEGYIDWNLSLNLQGGPNHVGNYCEAPLMIDSNNNEIKYMPSYYIIGHFSRYLRPGDVRIDVDNSDYEILVTAFKSSTEIKVVTINTSSVKKEISILIDNHYCSFVLKPKHISTFVSNLL